MPYLLRFFLVTPPLPSMMGWTFAVTAAVASVVLVLEPAQGAAAIMPVLVLQLFAAASGFSGSARRGYYDLLLTSGESRVGVAIAHWLMSINYGALAWMVLGGVELALTRGARSAILSTGTAAALLVLSTLPWALAVAQPRFGPSIGWLLLAATGAVMLPGGSLEQWLRSRSDGMQPVASAAAFLVYPPLVVGRPLSWADVPMVLPGIAVSLTTLVAACWWIARADYPLEASQ
jgi:hypothetical protein